MNEPELTEQQLKEITVQALKDAGGGISELKSNIEQCSDTFEEGDDSQGIKDLQEMTVRLQEFAEFCSCILKNCSEWLETDYSMQLIELGGDFEKVLNEVMQSTAAEDYIELADTLRLDLLNLLDKYNAHFAVMATALEERL